MRHKVLIITATIISWLIGCNPLPAQQYNFPVSMNGSSQPLQPTKALTAAQAAIAIGAAGVVTNGVVGVTNTVDISLTTNLQGVVSGVVSSTSPTVIAIAKSYSQTASNIAVTASNLAAQANDTAIFASNHIGTINGTNDPSLSFTVHTDTGATNYYHSAFDALAAVTNNVRIYLGAGVFTYTKTNAIGGQMLNNCPASNLTNCIIVGADNMGTTLICDNQSTTDVVGAVWQPFNFDGASGCSVQNLQLRLTRRLITQTNCPYQVFSASMATNVLLKHISVELECFTVTNATGEHSDALLVSVSGNSHNLVLDDIQWGVLYDPTIYYIPNTASSFFGICHGNYGDWLYKDCVSFGAEINQFEYIPDGSSTGQFSNCKARYAGGFKAFYLDLYTTDLTNCVYWFNELENQSYYQAGTDRSLYGFDQYTNLDNVTIFPTNGYIYGGIQANAGDLVTNGASPTFTVASNTSYTISMGELYINGGWNVFRGANLLTNSGNATITASTGLYDLYACGTGSITNNMGTSVGSFPRWGLIVSNQFPTTLKTTGQFDNNNGTLYTMTGLGGFTILPSKIAGGTQSRFHINDLTTSAAAWHVGNLSLGSADQVFTNTFGNRALCQVSVELDANAITTAMVLLTNTTLGISAVVSNVGTAALGITNAFTVTIPCNSNDELRIVTQDTDGFTSAVVRAGNIIY